MTLVSTKKLPATDFLGARVRVSGPDGQRATFPWDSELDTRENHVGAAVLFGRDKLGMDNVVATEIHRRPSADGYLIRLSTYTLRDDDYTAAAINRTTEEA